MSEQAPDKREEPKKVAVEPAKEPVKEPAKEPAKVAPVDAKDPARKDPAQPAVDPKAAEKAAKEKADLATANKALVEALRVESGFLGMGGKSADGGAALAALKGLSPENAAKIRAEYLASTGRPLEADLKNVGDAKTRNQAVGQIWGSMSLADKNRYEPKPEAILDNLKHANPEELKAFAADKGGTAAMLKNLDPTQRIEAMRMVDPAKAYDVARDSLKGNLGVFGGQNQSSAMEMFAKLSMTDRRRMVAENPSLLTPAMKEMAVSETAALTARMRDATAGAGTHDANLESITKDAGRLVAEQSDLEAKLKDPNLTPADKEAAQRRIAELGDVKKLLTPEREKNGKDLKAGSFLEMMHSDVGEAEFVDRLGKMGASSRTQAEQKVVNEMGRWFGPDQKKLEDAAADVKDPAERAKLLANPALAKEVASQLGADANKDFVGTFVNGTTDQISERKLTRNADNWSPDLTDMLKSSTSMSPEARKSFMESDRFKAVTANMNPQQLDAFRESMKTGSVDLTKTLAAAAGGNWDGTDEKLMEFAGQAQSPEQARRTALGMDLAQRGVAPSTDEERAALAEYQKNKSIIDSETEGRDNRGVQRALTDGVTAKPAATSEDRARGARLLLTQQDSEMSVKGGLSGWFSSTDEVANVASARSHGGYVEAMRDNDFSENEDAGFRKANETYVERQKEMVEAQQAITDAVVTGATVVAGTVATVLTAGTAAPLAAAAIAGVATTGTRIVTSAVMGGDNYERGDLARDVAKAPLDIAGSYVGGKAGDLVGKVLAPGSSLAANATVQAAETSMLRQAATTVTKSYADNVTSNALGSVSENLTNPEFYRQNTGDMLAKLGGDAAKHVASAETLQGMATGMIGEQIAGRLQAAKTPSTADATTTHADPAATHVDAPAVHPDAPVSQADVPVTKTADAAHVDTPAAHVDTPAAHVDAPAAHVDSPVAHAGDPAARVTAADAKVVPSTDGVPPTTEVAVKPADSARTSPDKNLALTPEQRLNKLVDEIDALQKVDDPALKDLTDRAYSRFTDDPADQLAALELLRSSGHDVDAVRARVTALDMPPEITSSMTHEQLAQIDAVRRQFENEDFRGGYERLSGTFQDPALRDRLLGGVMGTTHGSGSITDQPSLNPYAPRAISEVLSTHDPVEIQAKMPAVFEHFAATPGSDAAVAALRRLDGDPRAQAELARDLSTYQQLLKRRPELEAQNGQISKAYEALSPAELTSWMEAHVALSRNVLDNPDARLRKVIGDDQVSDMLSMQRGGKPVDQTRIGGSVGDAANTDGLSAQETIRTLGLDYADKGATPYLEKGPNGTLVPKDELFYVDTPMTQNLADEYKVPTHSGLRLMAKYMADADSEVAQDFMRLTKPHRHKMDASGRVADSADPLNLMGGTAPGPRLDNALPSINQEAHLKSAREIAAGATMNYRGKDGDFSLATYGIDAKTKLGSWAPNTGLTQAQYDLVKGNLPADHRAAIEAALAARANP
jgi:hypothetical protein